MKTFKEFMAQKSDLSLDMNRVLNEKSTDELFDMFVNRNDLTLHENRLIASGLYLRYRNLIFREKDINKKFRMLIDAIALSSVLTVREVKKILKENKDK